MPAMAARTVVIGLDGVTWKLLDPLIEADVMPRLAALRERGASGILKSTIPTYTPPAWTSAITGVNPGRHGVYGFMDGNAQSGQQNLVHSGRIQSATLWEIANAQQARVGIFNLPLTYPPRPLEGWMVSGMLTPGYGEKRRGFASWGGPGNDVELEGHILEWVPDYACDLSANWETDWRDDGLARRALESIGQRHTALSRLLDLDPVDVVFTVLETPDRMQHVYYRYMDPADEMYDTPAGKEIRPIIAECFAAMDRIVGLLDDYAGSAGGAIVCSDHGFTAWEASVHTNALLESWGWLRMKRGARLMQTRAARALVPVARRLLPAKVARQAKGRTFAAIDWSRTRAFASPIPQQGVFVNLRGRERFGIVEPSELDATKRALVEKFKALRSPDGEPVTDAVHTSDEVFSGQALDGAPDVLPVLRDHRFELDDEIFHRKPFTDQRHLPRGVHHPDGIVVVSGPGVTPKDDLAGSVLDVTPTLLYMAGLGVPDGLDGGVLKDAFDPSHLANHPVTTTAPLSSKSTDGSSPYSAEEEALIEESLRGLGYL
jgi:predicted AlkP superfamily phosphohydrolase/phosphomutase